MKKELTNTVNALIKNIPDIKTTQLVWPLCYGHMVVFYFFFYSLKNDNTANKTIYQ